VWVDFEEKRQAMKFGVGASYWSLVFATSVFALLILLARVYPSSFWAVTDYEPHGLGDALNMAYRLADLQMYEAAGMSYHPGVPFYILSWLALALAGYPIAYKEPNFFRLVIDHVEDYHRMILLLAALVGAAAVYLFAKAVRNLVPTSVTCAAILLWLVSTPGTLLMFMSPSIDSFAMLINALFMCVLVPLAFEKDIDPWLLVLAGGVGALAYLNKLSYIYVPLALGIAITAKLIFCRAGWWRSLWSLGGYVGCLLIVIFAAVFAIMGWEAFTRLLSFHWSVILGSELYGSGDQTVVSQHEVLRAMTSIVPDRAYAIPIGLFGGIAVAMGGLITGLKWPDRIAVAVIGVAAGSSAALSALFVLKHYDLHYTAGVSATLPACVVACHLLLQAWQIRVRMASAVAVFLTLLLMAVGVAATVNYTGSSRVRDSQLAQADLREIDSYLAESGRTVEFAYRAPFARFGEGIAVTVGSVPRMIYDYLRGRPKVISSHAARYASRDVGAYVIDKSYFPTAESVKTAPNIALGDANAVRFRDVDTLIELRTVFLLIRG
jgi:hypothetical protein